LNTLPVSERKRVDPKRGGRGKRYPHGPSKKAFILFSSSAGKRSRGSGGCVRWKKGEVLPQTQGAVQVLTMDPRAAKRANSWKTIASAKRGK